MSPGILIQSRLKSRRLPYKALRPLCGATLIEYLVDRLSIGYPVILCTSRDEQDDPLEIIANRAGIDCYRGSRDNLAERFYNAAIKYRINPIIRVTGDNPLTDINIMLDLLGKHDGGYTYCHAPRGTKSEIIATEILTDMFGLHDQERNFTPWLKKHPRAKRVTVHSDGLVDCTVDTWADYAKIRKLCEYS